MATMAQPQAAVTGGGRIPRQTQAQNQWTPYLFILPHLIMFAAFIGWPFINGLLISFQQYDILRPEANKYIGLQNYTSLLSTQTV